MTQLLLKSGLKEWVTKYQNAVHYYMKKLHSRNMFKPIHLKELEDTQRNSISESQMLLKQNRVGKTKGRTVADGNIQRYYISKEYSISPTIST